MIIELNEAEQRLAKYLAAKRHEHARADGVRNARIGPQSDEETDREGIAAEIAFAKYMNVYPDLDPGGDRPSIDAVLHDGRTVDIKTTKHPSGRLLAARWKQGDVTLFALMVGEFPRYRFAGIMTAEQLLDPARLADLGYGKTYVAYQEELIGEGRANEQGADPQARCAVNTGGRAGDM